MISMSSKMKRTRRPSLALLVILALGSECVLSFSAVDKTNRASPRACLVRKNRFVGLNGKDGDGDGDDNDGKIDWNPEKNAKIAQAPSYSDNWLLNFHLWDQSEKQLVTNSLTVWNEVIRDQQATIIEWQDSFQRNDLADFTPPMSNGMNCLMVGDGFDEVDDRDGNRRLKLPWEEEPEAQITSLRVLEESVESIGEIADETGSIASMDEDNQSDEVVITIDTDNDNEDKDISKSIVSSTESGRSTTGTNGAMIRTELVAPDSETASSSSSAIRAQDANRQAAAYDCIVDQGLMDRILALENSDQTVRELLEEAAIAIKDLGIYVLVTKELTDDSRRILEDYGLKAGLEWQFELDGISDDTQVVSVARRFCTGEMPPVGRLSRYQPERLW